MTDLSRFPRPNVAVDVAVLTVIPSPDPALEPGRLGVLLHERTSDPAGWVLPGRFLRPDEDIAACIGHAVSEKLGIDLAGRVPEVLRVNADPGRDQRGWTVSLAHSVVLPPEMCAATTGAIVPVSSRATVPRRFRLGFDHPAILAAAVTRMRDRYELTPDPDDVIGGPFTLSELRTAHEAVLGVLLAPDTFRRRMSPQMLPALENGEQLTRSDGGRPARLWTGPGELTDEARARLQLPRDDRVNPPKGATR